MPNELKIRKYFCKFFKVKLTKRNNNTHTQQTTQNKTKQTQTNTREKTKQFEMCFSNQHQLFKCDKRKKK